MNGTKIDVQIDSGSEANIISERDLCRLKEKPQLRRTNTKLYPFATSQPLKLLGKFTGVVETSECYKSVLFYVVPRSQKVVRNILGLNTSMELGILKIVKPAVNSIQTAGTKTETASSTDVDSQKLISEFSDLTSGVGRAGKVSLDIDEKVKPVAQKHRRTPFHLRPVVEEQIKQLLENDLIEKVPDHEATEWVSPIVLPKKSDGSHRLCVDMVQPNKAIRRIRHVIPTIEELRHEFNGCNYFTKIDLNQGYHQFELEENSRSITTFSTHLGLYRYKVLNFGTNSAAEIFHEEIRKRIAPIPMRVKNIFDDVLIGGVTKKECMENTRKLFEIFRANNITINLNKCVFCKPSVVFYGLIFTNMGIHPDPEKVESLRQAETPKDKTELRSFLGMTNYSAPFIPNYSTKTSELRKLLKDDVKWTWSDTEETAFNNLKSQLCENSVLNYYDVTLKTAIVCDASPVGLSAILVQYSGEIHNLYTNPKIIAYASRSLTPTEMRYGQIEREALSIHFGCRKFEMYVIGSNFTVVTDHQPLVSLFNSPRKPGPFRVERMRLKLMGFSFNVVYKSGKWNPSDYLSRHPRPISNATAEELEESLELECYIIDRMQSDLPDAISTSKIQKATLEDPVLSKILLGLQKENLQKQCPEFKEYVNYFDELSVADDVVLRGERTVIPKNLVNDVVSIGHEGHQGIVKCKRLLRSLYWFPRMDEIITKKVSKCRPCQAAVETPSEEPIQSSILPDYPWQSVDLDFLGPLPSGDYILVAIDAYSRFPEVFVVRSTSFYATVKHLNKLLSSYGIPETIKTDNGPPFKSWNFKKFAKKMGFKHRRITPRHPKANGLVENFNKVLIKTLKIARMQGLPWQREMFTFLRSYRATPHLTTGKSPAELFFQQRPFRTRLGHRGEAKLNDEEVREHDMIQKNKSKSYSDKRSYVKNIDIQKGDQVLVKLTKVNKLTPNYDPKPYVVMERKGTMITAKRNYPHHVITRNVSFFKKLNVEHDDDNYDYIDNDRRSNVPEGQQEGQQPLRRSARNRRPPIRFPEPDM